jgi:leucine-rich repeats and immunoglobulin-like domains protein 1/3
MHPNSLVGLDQLENLNLSHNSIRSLPDKVFRDLTKLKKLELNSNKIEKIHKQTFFGLVCLQTLDISVNLLSNLSAFVFSELTSLKIVKLSQNKIQNVDKHAFNGLASVEEIFLNSNLIKQDNLHDETFLQLQNLSYLNLDYNCHKS